MRVIALLLKDCIIPMGSRIEPKTLRRSTLPDPKPIPLSQPKWVR
ncbi:hypothetical protein MtrunA17_Chr3g0082531 [Medicago truncatula]|uniref:Uncharacterized protein n=1 Tax=Medicago truncatula TaxID=3880 RepID=A0A396IJ37_MEDTR|nr:hypothetical protein MtrunA17_Chr3g0082531 [Medicago truncatula]